MENTFTLQDLSAVDFDSGVFVGRIWQETPYPGPRTVALRDGSLMDLSLLAPTSSDLLDLADPASAVRAHGGERLCSLEQALTEERMLAPCDWQAIKACGVTFAQSLLERLVEEQANGSAREADRLRAELEREIGGALSAIRPGSEESGSLKQAMQKAGTWSQYLEVGLGQDPEVFTKAQPLAAVGFAARLGLREGSDWCASEPEIVLAVNSRGETVGASLGNDLTLRDFEGRSALLLGQAKDFNASCAIGPFIRLFDQSFDMDDVRRATVEFRVEGLDGFEERGKNDMTRISRDPEALVAAAVGDAHQYPDGLMLFLGTMYVPVNDRRGPGSGFTHRAGDVVRVSSPGLGALVNRIEQPQRVAPWSFGARDLARSLQQRGVL